jgi:type IV pilus assembly protein PilQ
MIRKLLTTVFLSVAFGWHAAPAEVLFRSDRTELPNASATVTLDADEAPLAAALSLLAVQVGVNIIVAPGVTGEVSIHLTDIPFREALEALTAGHDIGYYTAGDVVVITPKTTDSRVGMATLAFRLRHLRPESILEAAKALMSPEGEAVPLISSGGREAGSGDERQEGAPPVILFRDYPNYLAELESSLMALDVPQHQVQIEVKFVEARTEDLKQLGIEWPANMTVGLTGASLGNETESGSSSSEGGGEANYAYTNDLNTSDVQWGTIAVSQVSAVLNYLVQNGHGRVLSQPKLSVMDNEEAAINVTTTTPVQTINRFSEGAVIQDVVTYQYIEVGIQLKVRPRISDDGYVSLHVHPIFEEILAMVGPSISPAPVTAKRSVETTIKVKSGDTIILGGLLRERELESQSKVWLLGDIPILGALFRNTRTETEQGELLIMITPTILPQS